MKKINKKPLMALASLAVIGAVGGALAYFTSTDTFENVFKTRPYNIEVVETFESPDNWTPGTTTEKNVVVNNRGDVEAAVRVSLTEKWVDAEGNDLDFVDANDEKAAIINFAGDYANTWTMSEEDGVIYYYYNKALAPQASTESLIESVTFNPNFEIAQEHNCETIDNVTTCRTSTAGHAGGTYTLDVKVETAQFDQYKEIWNTEVEIGE